MIDVRTNSDGYFMDDIYIPVYNDTIDPRVISSKARFFGFSSAPTDQPFCYGDFGCGLGTDIIMLACIFPHAQFYGFDINSAQIAHARKLAAHLNLANVTFINASFSDISSHETPALDYAVNTGVISWVSKSVRAELVKAISSCISETGLVFVSYQVTPGSIQESNFRYLLTSLINTGATAQQAFAILSDSIPNAPKYNIQKDKNTGENLRYLKHEYISDHWNPVYPSEMIQAFAAGGFGFCGPFDAPDGITKKLNGLDAKSNDLFQLDFFSCSSNQGGRSDIFSKQASLKNLDRLSLDQEPNLFRLPMPIGTNETDEQRLSQNAFSKNRACRPLKDILSSGVSGAMRHLVFQAFERTQSVLTDKNVAPVACSGEFKITNNFVDEQFKLDDFVSWRKGVIIIRESSLIITCPKPIYRILTQLAGVPKPQWIDKLNHDNAAGILKIWEEHWAPILTAHNVISPLDFS